MLVVALFVGAAAPAFADEAPPSTTEPATEEGPLTLKQARSNAEGKALRRALAVANGNISEAARLLDTSRPTLYQLLKEHNIEL